MTAAHFCMRRRVTFAETDMAGILHFSNYFRYMEETEHAFFRSLGMRVHPQDAAQAGFLGFARRQATCDYQAPLHYEDDVELSLRVVELRGKAVVYEVAFWLDGEEVARGRMVAVCIEKTDDGALRACAIPDQVRDKLTASTAPGS